MDWMILTGGQPAEPDSLDELANARRPKDFWRALFDEVAKVDVSASTTVEQAGRAGFRHGELRVRFKTGKERDTFSAAWQRVFGRSPSFGASS